MKAVTFAVRLAALRRAAGLTQGRLAEAAAVSRRTLEGWEIGRGMPPLDVGLRLAEALGVTLDRLAGRRGVKR